MAESSSTLMLEATEILITPSHEGLTRMVDQIFNRQEHKSAKALFDVCVVDFANELLVKLLQLYLSSPSNGILRFRSIYLFTSALPELSKRNFNLSPFALHEIQSLVISCLTLQETKESDIKILRKIVAFVAYNVVKLHNCEWEELSDLILSLVTTQPWKAMLIYTDLPLLYGQYTERFLQRFFDLASNMLRHIEEDKAKPWSLALEAAAKVGIQISHSNRSALIRFLQDLAESMVVEQLYEHIEIGLDDLKNFVLRNANLYDKYSKDHVTFVGKIGFCILAAYRSIEDGKIFAKEILRMFRNQEKVKDSFDRDWYDHLRNLSSLEVLRIFASTDLDDKSREVAIKRLKVLLSKYRNNSSNLNPRGYLSELGQLQPLLILCLEEEEISDRIFKILCKVVNRVNYQMMIRTDEIWFGLREYITLKCETEFEKAVYLFQCLTMELDEEAFVIPVMETLLPEIKIRLRLDQPSERLVDNSDWVLTFTGAFCVIIRLIDVPCHAKSVKVIAYKMIDSVRILAERFLEVGLMRRAFRDVESIVKKQVDWYETSEYKFVKGLLWRLYPIEGIEWESKIVLWRINLFLEREVDELNKELPENDFDWINQPEED